MGYVRESKKRSVWPDPDAFPRLVVVHEIIRLCRVVGKVGASVGFPSPLAPGNNSRGLQRGKLHKEVCFVSLSFPPCVPDYNAIKLNRAILKHP